MLRLIIIIGFVLHWLKKPGLGSGGLLLRILSLGLTLLFLLFVWIMGHLHMTHGLRLRYCPLHFLVSRVVKFLTYLPPVFLALSLHSLHLGLLRSGSTLMILILRVALILMRFSLCFSKILLLLLPLSWQRSLETS